MKLLTLGIVLVVVSWLSANILIRLKDYNTNTITVKYDCQLLIGGWHPDVPSAVQEQCKSRRTDAGSKTRN